MEAVYRVPDDFAGIPPEIVEELRTRFGARPGDLFYLTPTDSRKLSIMRDFYQDRGVGRIIPHLTLLSSHLPGLPPGARQRAVGDHGLNELPSPRLFLLR